MGILLITACLLPIVLYLTTWRLGLHPGRLQDYGLEPAAPRAGFSTALTPASMLLAAAILSHAFALYLGIVSEDGLRFGFAHIISAALLVGVSVLWLDGEHPHSGAMRTLILPVAALAAPLPLIFSGALLGDTSGRPLFLPHLLVGTLAYAVLLLAVVHALLMALTEKNLHGAGSGRGMLGRLVERFPPLLTMERLLFRLLLAGFILLTLTAVSGLFFSDAVFGRSLRLDHKTIFTLIAWLVFGLLLLGRWLWGWRGRTAVRLTIVGFVVVLLGYVGSRFVLEVILGRV